MLLTITTTHRPASDLSFLLAKHPDRFQSFDLSFGAARVFYPHVSADSCTAALLLDADPIGLVRGKDREQRTLMENYVNDRPYVASSFLSVAIAQVFGSALNGRCKERAELVGTPIPLEAKIAVLPVRAGEGWLQKIFEPLGYSVEAVRSPLDPQFPEWGDSPYHTLTLRGVKTLRELLTHLYVLIPAFYNDKHYYVGDEELEKLLQKGAGWLASHPEKDWISRRYLRHQKSLVREAQAKLVGEELASDDRELNAAQAKEDSLEKALSLHEQRHQAVVAELRACGAKSVADLGCGEGKLLRLLHAERQFEKILGLDVSVRALEVADRRLKKFRRTERQADRIELIHGSLLYRDRRLQDFDAISLVEVIEHLDPPRLRAMERAVFEFARPKTVVLTTPNREYNATWPSLAAGSFRHTDHRFEWTRAEFSAWGTRIGSEFSYDFRAAPIGPCDDQLGPPTQMGIFQRTSA